MRFLVNAFSVSYGGALTVARELLPLMARTHPEDEYDLLVKDRALEKVAVWPANVRFIVYPTAGRHLLLRNLWEQTRGVRLFRAANYDLYVSLAGFGLLRGGARQVILIRNAMFFEDCSWLTLKSRFKVFWQSRLQVHSLKAGASAVCVSEYMADRVREKCGRLSGLMSVIPHGISQDLYTSRQAGRRCGPDHPLRLLWIGLWTRHKNLRDLIDALSTVEREGGRVCEVTLAGKLSESDRAEILAAAKAANVASQIRFPGYCDHARLIELYNGCDLYINTSLLESFDNCVAEAMALGVPTVASDIPVHQEYGQDALLYYRGGDARDLASKIVEIAGDDRKREHLVRRCVELVAERTWANVARQYHDFFTLVAGGLPIQGGQACRDSKTEVSE